MNETTLREALKSIPRYVLDGPEGAEEYVPTPDGDLIFADDLDAALVRADAPDDTLDAAWKEAEAALPEGWNWEDITRLTGDSEGEWSACARNDTGVGRYRWCGVGPTPAAALRALAARLQGEQG